MQIHVGKKKNYKGSLKEPFVTNKIHSVPSSAAVTHLDSAVGRCADDVMTVLGESRFVDKRRMTTELLERLPRFQAMDPVTAEEPRQHKPGQLTEPGKTERA